MTFTGIIRVTLVSAICSVFFLTGCTRLSGLEAAIESSASEIAQLRSDMDELKVKNRDLSRVVNAIEDKTKQNTSWIETHTTTYHPPDPRPVANFHATPNWLVEGELVTFTNATECQKYDLEELQWLWVFGDGTSQTSQTASHVYSHPGTYLVKLHATDPEGNKNTASRFIDVKELPSCTLYLHIESITQQRNDGIGSEWSHRVIYAGGESQVPTWAGINLGTFKQGATVSVTLESTEHDDTYPDVGYLSILYTADCGASDEVFCRTVRISETHGRGAGGWASYEWCYRFSVR